MRAHAWTLALLLFLPLLARAASGAPPELDIFTLYSSRSLNPGEEANFTVHTFIDGKRASVSGGVEARIAGGIYGLETLLTVRAVSAGIYEFSYIMTASHADRYGNVHILVSASHSSWGPSGEVVSTDSEWVTLSLRSSGSAVGVNGWSVAASLTELSAPLPAPGSRASFKCWLSKGGSPADPESISFIVSHEGAGEEPMSYTAAHERLAPGVYLVNFTVPDVAHSDCFYLSARIPEAGGELFTGAWLRLNFFTVLYRELGTREGLRTFEILVSDRSGKAVRGADVRLVFNASLGDGAKSELALGRTDSRGRVSGAIPAPEFIDRYYVTGWTNTSRFSQSFEGWILLPRVSSITPPDNEYFYVLPLSYSYHPEPHLRPGDSFSAAYRAFWRGQPVAGQELRCYVTMRAYDSSYSRVLSSSVECIGVLTDPSGNLTLNLTMLPGEASTIEVFFKNPFPPPQFGAYNDGDSDYFSAYSSGGGGGPELAASFTRASPGQTVRVLASAPGSEPLCARVAWDVTGDGRGAVWRAWSSLDWYLGGPDESGAFSGRVALPDHLKPGMNLSFRLTLFNQSSSIEESFDVEVEAAPAESQGADICCLAGLAVVNLGLILFLVASYIASRRPPEGGSGEGTIEGKVQEILERAERRPESLPRRVAMEASGPCSACGRRVARGSLALICTCGRRFHEHCVGDRLKCPSCGRAWRDKYL
ncbi:MAG: PHD finger domain-containing protein [Thermoplasmatota archaeon]